MAIGTGVVAVLIVGLGIGIASAAQSRSTAAPGTIVCPTVSDRLPAVPAQAKAEVERNLALLNTQVAEANQRLRDTVGQGGANFVQNAILGPLKDKRVATINRIATAIGRNAPKPQGLAEQLGTCQLVGAGAAVPTEPTVVPTAPAQGGNTGNTGGNTGNTGNTGGNAGPGRIVCPSVADQLPAIPAQAQAEVDRNLAQLDTQIAEANQRLRDTVGQGGANFVQNAILGPLKDKRVAAINRIATAIGRNAPKPQGLAERLATCQLVAA
jgi:F0F1-type ATP synthase membrane subunit b/b'